MKCACGEDHPGCLDFHHVTDDKEVNVGDAVRLGWSIKRLMTEINKCVVMCSNCHRKHHYVRYLGVAQPGQSARSGPEKFVGSNPTTQTTERSSSRALH
ncbi:hypothetical protein MESS4_510136 [Mesorhizobium sp. STM 4661]|nr:hypothetical protein MESS4_510136 [Mesorhizobium sp. STM 4661]